MTSENMEEEGNRFGWLGFEGRRIRGPSRGVPCQRLARLERFNRFGSAH